MKKLPFVCAAVILLSWSSAEARQQKVVRVKPGFATVIVCPVPPELVSVGDAQQFVVQNSGNYILVKPVVSSGSTNMFIKAGMDSYNLLLQVSPNPDLEVRLLPTQASQATPPKPAPEKSPKGTASKTPDFSTKNGATIPATSKSLDAVVSPKARSILSSYFKTPRPYTYSVKNSDVVFAVDYMVQVEDKLYVICTVVNNSKIPYDIGFVRFKLIDYDRSMLVFKKKVKETELEPIRDFYNAVVKPSAMGRLLFVFDKQGFTHKSTVEIKCSEENGQRDLVLNVPASYVE